MGQNTVTAVAGTWRVIERLGLERYHTLRYREREALVEHYGDGRTMLSRNAANVDPRALCALQLHAVTFGNLCVPEHQVIYEAYPVPAFWVTFWGRFPGSKGE